MTTRNATLKLPRDLYERLSTAAQAESIDPITLIENLLKTKEEKSDLPDEMSDDFDPSTAPIYRVHKYAVDTGIPDLAQNLDHYLYGHPKNRDE